jgi:predicted Zn-dependent protease
MAKQPQIAYGFNRNETGSDLTAFIADRPFMVQVDEPIFDAVFETVIQSPQRTPASWLPRRLNALFVELQRFPARSDPEDTTDLIWALWIRHSNEEAASSMNAAIEAMSAGAFDLARPLLDRLVSDYPDWSEAWNKRATIAYAEKRDSDALADMQRTLTIEPRHFGAMIGFAQICVRHRRFTEAKAAFEIACHIHPHINGLQAIIADLTASQHRMH